MAITILDSLFKDLRLDSRFRSTYLEYDTDIKKMFRDNWAIYSIPPSDDDVFHTVQSGEKNRIDLISNYYYNNVRLWWVIALANNLFCPLFIKPGDVLRIPSINRVYRNILKK